ncbi:MAG: alpha-2,8-polysialyltransferase family protein [Ruminococcus flavefaciens]|nr:alpha-2,8-polysialyltransferase family protein [Ruminococcus flavefaciens]
MMKRCLFVARSYYMLIVVLQLKLTYYKNDYTELIWCNDSQNSREIYDRLCTLKIFHKCHYIEHEHFAPANNIYDKITTTLKIYTAPHKLLEEFALNCYDELVLYTINRKLENALYVFCKKNNPALKCYLYEEAYVSYIYKEGYHKKLTGLLKIASETHRLLSLVFPDAPQFERLSGRYFFEPRLILFNTHLPFFQIEKINKEAFKKNLNFLFDINGAEILHQYNYKYIYFEQSVLSNTPVSETEIVQKISNKVGAKNLLVKLHPRTKGNPYEQLGVITNKSPGIPWEIILMNIQCNEKVLITLTSNSVISSLIHFGEFPKIIMLYNCFQGFISSADIDQYINKLIQAYPQANILVPKSEDELSDIL